MPHSAGNQSLCISKIGKEGEIKKGKLKRKQGGRRGKEVRSCRNQQRSRDNGKGLQRQRKQRAGRREAMKINGSSVVAMRTKE